jgi:Flp pilus assembly protein TadG
MIELAITLMGFLMLTMGAMEASWAVYTWNTCVSSAQDAVRWASVRGAQSATPATNDDIKTYVRSIATGLDPTQIGVSTTWTPNNSPGSTVQVTVSYTFVPMAYMAIKQNMNFSSAAQVVINH